MHAGHANAAEVKELQRHLRALGYLRQGIDGGFGKQTTLAIRSLHYDLLNNTGESSGGDGAAPVSVVNFNRGRVIDITGVLDQGLAGCMHDMIREENFPKIPSSENPAAANAEIIRLLRDNRDLDVPTPFLIAMLRQESNLRHFSVPKNKDEDNFLIVGLDRNSKKVNAEVAITSRGYGAGQYTLFHHPPRAAEVQDFIRFYLTEGAVLAKEVGYVPLPDEAYKLALKHFSERKLGTVFGGSPEVGVTIDNLLAREGTL